MSVESNKAVVRRAYEEGMNTRSMGVVEECFTPDYVAHFPGVAPIRGRDALEALLAAFFEAFPDIVFRVDDLIGEGDRVVARWSADATHSGVFRGFPPRTRGVEPTGRKVNFSATDIYRMVDGKIAEEWNTLEQLDVLHQLGVLPPDDRPEESR